jgi:hypothetical protein
MAESLSDESDESDESSSGDRSRGGTVPVTAEWSVNSWPHSAQKLAVSANSVQQARQVKMIVDSTTKYPISGVIVKIAHPQTG